MFSKRSGFLTRLVTAAFSWWWLVRTVSEQSHFLAGRTCILIMIFFFFFHSRLYFCQCAVFILVTRYVVVSVIDFNPDLDVTLTSTVGCARVWIRLWTGSKWFRIQYYWRDVANWQWAFSFIKSGNISAGWVCVFLRRILLCVILNTKLVKIHISGAHSVLHRVFVEEFYKEQQLVEKIN